MRPVATAPHLEDHKVAVKGDFAGENGGVATDISGIASATPLGEARRKCLVIDNETRAAQFASFDLEERTLTVGDLVPLLPDDRATIVAVGTAPDDGDPGPDRYILDGEGVAWLEPHYYIAGSHSIHDHEDTGELRADYRRSAHLVARVGRDGTQPELSYRLNEVLQDLLAPHFLRSPNKSHGINIEGVAGWRRRLYFGLRTPVLDRNALIVSVRAEALFTSTGDLAAKLVRVPMGGAGIRDLATLPDGRFLILSGPEGDLYEGFGLMLFDRKTGSAQHLGTIERRGREKPEALFLAGLKPAAADGDTAEILVMSDGAKNGRPRLYKLAIPPP